MVYRKKSQKKSFARRKPPQYKKKKKRYVKNYTELSSKINIGPAIVPDTYITKLKYTQRVELSFTTGGVDTQIFRGNSLFDPDASGVGAQPTGFDQLASLYNRYRVLGSSISIIPTSYGASAAGSMFECAVYPTVDFTAVTDPETARTNPYGKWLIVGAMGRNVEKVRNYMSTGKIMGLDSSTVNSRDDLGALASASPAIPWYWTIIGQPVDHTSTFTAIAYCTLTYYCRFESRASQELS